ncbi:MAG: radical SAM protein [Thermodesulfobacteriota bacterium]
MTDLILINPGNRKQAYGSLAESLAGVEPPLMMALLAAYLREKGFSVSIIDAEAEGLDADQTADIIARHAPRAVGIGAIGANPSASSTPKMTAIRPLLNRIKGRNLPCKTVLFGIHSSALPERTLREEAVDFVVRGEVFYPVEQLLRMLLSGEDAATINGLCLLRNDCFVDNGRADVVEDLDSLPLPAWDLLPMAKYRAHNWHCLDDVSRRSPYGVIYTSLGCPFHCDYCNIHEMYGGHPGIRFRSPGRVLEDIDRLYQEYKICHLKIMDELFVINENRVMEICDLLIERDYGLNIWAYARVDTVTGKVLKKLKQAGVNWLAFGIEAGADAVRQGVSKGRFDGDRIRDAVAKAHGAGINVLGNFMFGLPDDDMDTMGETLALARELECEYANFYTTMAYPGSALYEDAVTRGLPLPRTWGGFAQLSPEAMPLPTKHLTAAEVLRFRDDAFASYFSAPSYLAMIEKKFGPQAVVHIRRMLSLKLRRDILSGGG